MPSSSVDVYRCLYNRKIFREVQSVKRMKEELHLSGEVSLVKTISALKTTKFKTFLVVSLTVNFHLSFKYNVQILTIILPETLQD